MHTADAAGYARRRASLHQTSQGDSASGKAWRRERRRPWQLAARLRRRRGLPGPSPGGRHLGSLLTPFPGPTRRERAGSVRNQKCAHRGLGSSDGSGPSRDHCPLRFARAGLLAPGHRAGLTPPPSNVDRTRRLTTPYSGNGLTVAGRGPGRGKRVSYHGARGGALLRFGSLFKMMVRTDSA